MQITPTLRFFGAVRAIPQLEQIINESARTQADPEHRLGKVHAGIEIIAKKPLSVWLRSLGKGIESTSNWETSSGSFKHTYLPAILIPDAQNSYTSATMLMESGGYRAGYLYEIMMGEKNSNIKLTALLAEGADYERISFQWLNSTED